MLSKQKTPRKQDAQIRRCKYFDMVTMHGIGTKLFKLRRFESILLQKLGYHQKELKSFLNFIRLLKFFGPNNHLVHSNLLLRSCREVKMGSQTL